MPPNVLEINSVPVKLFASLRVVSFSWRPLWSLLLVWCQFYDAQFVCFAYKTCRIRIRVALKVAACTRQVLIIVYLLWEQEFVCIDESLFGGLTVGHSPSKPTPTSTRTAILRLHWLLFRRWQRLLYIRLIISLGPLVVVISHYNGSWLLINAMISLSIWITIQVCLFIFVVIISVWLGRVKLEHLINELLFKLLYFYLFILGNALVSRQKKLSVLPCSRMIPTLQLLSNETATLLILLRVYLGSSRISHIVLMFSIFNRF